MPNSEWCSGTTKASGQVGTQLLTAYGRHSPLHHPFVFSAKPHCKAPAGEEQRPPVIAQQKPVAGVLILQRQTNQHTHSPQGTRVQEEGAWAVLHHDSLEYSQPDGPFPTWAPDGRDQHPSAYQLQQPLCDHPALGEGGLHSRLYGTGRRSAAGIRGIRVPCR